MITALLRTALIATVLYPLAISATPIAGSDSIALINVAVTPTGAPLFPISGVTDLSYTFGLTSGVGTGNFAIIAVGTFITSSALYPSGHNGGNGTTPFSFTIAGFGTFTETVDPSVLTNGTNGHSTGVNLYLLGIFVPSGALSAFSSNTASFDVSFTQTGGSYSGSGTFDVPPAASTAPEPSSLVLLGTGLLGSVGLLRKRLFS
jgi:hypothetical protein